MAILAVPASLGSSSSPEGGPLPDEHLGDRDEDETALAVPDWP